MTTETPILTSCGKAAPTATFTTDTGLTLTGILIDLVWDYGTVRVPTRYHADGFVTLNGTVTHIDGVAWDREVDGKPDAFRLGCEPWISVG